MSQEHLRVDLASSGFVDLLVSVAWLDLSDDDLAFVRGLWRTMSAYSEPAIGVDTGEAGGGGGFEPPAPPPPPEPVYWPKGDPEWTAFVADREQNYERRFGHPFGERPLIMDSPLMDGEPAEGEGGSSVGVETHVASAPSHPEPVRDEIDGERLVWGNDGLGPSLDPPGLLVDELDAAAAVEEMIANRGTPSSGYKCDRCPRVLATLAGKARHMTVAHGDKRSKVERVTADQERARKALLDGDPISTELVDCGHEGCTARRSSDAIARHRLSMHGVG